MFKSLAEIFSKALQVLFDFFGGILARLLELLWGALKKVFESLFSLLSTIWGRVLATLTLITTIALGPLLDVAKDGFSALASKLGASPDVISSFFGNNVQALCYVAVNYCSLDVMLTNLIAFMGVLTLCFTLRVSVWGARKIASIVRGAGV